MPIYEITPDSIRALPRTTFESEGIGERNDLQRLLCGNVSVIDPDLFVVAEEVSEWEDSKRRIDILALDRAANLVVVELKRTQDGGHMELQAVRYAAMISALTFEQAVKLHEGHRRKYGLEGDAGEAMLSFLGWESEKEDEFAEDVRIVLVSGDFSKELTTSVLWLNERGLDIRCVRLRPYKVGDRVFAEAQQVIPLPEAAEFQVQVREKVQREREAKAERSVFRRFWTGLLAKAKTRSTLHANVSPGQEQWASASVRGYQFNYFVRKHDCQVEVYITAWSPQENLAAFEKLRAKKEEIEAAFGSELDWMALEGQKACRVRKVLEVGGHKSPEEKWPEIQDALVDAMCRLERAVMPRLR